MKKLSFLLIFIPFLGVGILQRSVVKDHTSVLSYTSTPNVSIGSGEVVISTPKRLIIKSLNIETNIEHVGAASDGRMDVPKNNDNVAWWSPGTIPGKKGSAVLAGHYDNPDGRPSVFYNLEDIETGEIVTVIDNNGLRQDFKVIDKKRFKDASFPIDLVFEQDDSERLNLITCAGIFNKDEDKYEDRLVIFTQKVHSS